MERKAEPFKFMVNHNPRANLLDLEKEWRIAQQLGYVHRPFSEVKGRELLGWKILMNKHASMIQREIERITANYR